jgi:hypothetical protein
MDEEVPGEDRSTLRDSSMTILMQLKKGGHGTSLFLTLILRNLPNPSLQKRGDKISPFGKGGLRGI